MIAMVMRVLDARQTAQTEAGVWQSHDHNMSPFSCALKPSISLLPAKAASIDMWTTVRCVTVLKRQCLHAIFKDLLCA